VNINMTKLTRRATLATAATVMVPLAAPALRAETFPSRPLRLVCTYPPAGVTDIVSRIFAEALGRQLGQQVVVDNRPGAGGNIGMLAVAQSEPDGYTIVLGTAATHGVNPVIYASSGLNPARDLATIGIVGETPNVLSVNPGRLDVKNVAELVAAAKRPDGLIYGSVGNGSSSHLSAVLFLQKTGIDATHVPYRGSAPTVSALLAKEVDFIFDTTASSTNQVRAGNFRALGVTTAHRSFALPEVPTLQEAGVPDYDLPVWFGLFAPGRTPAPVLPKLREALAASMDETTKKRLHDAYVEPLEVPEAQLQDFVRSQAERWKALARSANLTAD
jgi:tripartite-type tricarboxylate transporter receptor subunit TctC